MTPWLLWKPKDEIEFMAGLCEELPPQGNHDSRLDPSASRPQSKPERLAALRKYLDLLPYRVFPGWTDAEIGKVIAAGWGLYEKNGGKFSLKQL